MKNLQKIYVSILCSIVLSFGIISPLKGQGNDSKVWDSMSEGRFEMTNNYRVGDYVVITTVLEKATKPAIINNESALQPISVWDMQGDSFVNFSSNWVGDPMNPVKMFMYDSSRLFITDGVKIIRADIDFQYKTISYQQTFQGNSDSNNIIAFYKGKNNVYFTSSYGKNFVYICDMFGNIEKTITMNTSALLSITSIVEWDDTIYFGYTYVGGLADGSGFAILDPLTGQITKIRDPLWMNNANGCYISVVGGHFYLKTDPGLYNFEPSLFEYKNGSWKTIIIGGLLPKEQDGKVTVLVRPDGHYPNDGDTINKTPNGARYLFNPQTGLVGWLIQNDLRLDIQFTETFKTQFYKRNGFFPAIEFIYEFGNKTIGFGPSIVGKLIDPTSGIKTPKVRTVLNVLPNPATGDVVYIQGLQKPTEYTITNTTGQTVANGLTMDEVSISTLTPGIYFLSIPKLGATAKFVRN